CRACGKYLPHAAAFHSRGQGILGSPWHPDPEVRLMEPLEASVTLEEIFTIVASKRVPLAPELAGYLTLEIAETPAAREGEVDPRHVYIGEEGTVALVRPKKE